MANKEERYLIEYELLTIYQSVRLPVTVHEDQAVFLFSTKRAASRYFDAISGTCRASFTKVPFCMLSIHFCPF